MTHLVVRDPFAGFSPFARRAFRRHGGKQRWMPVNIYETDGGVAIDATLPGFERDDIAVTYNDGRLTIRAAHDADSCEEERHNHLDRRYRHREVYRRQLERSFEIGDRYDTDLIQAELSNGVLHLELKRSGETEPKQIEINVN